VETIPAIEEKVFKIQPLEVESQTKLVEGEFRTIKTKVQVNTIEQKVGTKLSIVVQVEIIEIIIEKTNV
jgi:hypothetical protein